MAENEIGPDGHHLVTGEPDPPGGGHADVVMDDIRPPNETFDNIGRVRRLQIERERPLSSLRAEKGPLHAAHHVTPGSLDLDDVGTQIAQNHRCQRTCDERTEVDNMNALERETIRSEEHTSELQSLMHT